MIERAKTIQRAIKLRKITDTKNEAKKIKSDNFTRSNKEKPNIDCIKFISHLKCTNIVIFRAPDI